MKKYVFEYSDGNFIHDIGNIVKVLLSDGEYTLMREFNGQTDFEFIPFDEVVRLDIREQ